MKALKNTTVSDLAVYAVFLLGLWGIVAPILAPVITWARSVAS